MKAGRRARRGALPPPGAVIAFVRGAAGGIAESEIARAFALAPADRVSLRAMLREAELSGAVARGPGGRYVGGAALPEIAVVERFGEDEDGMPLARPVAWPGPEPAPTLRLSESGVAAALPVGARAAARLVPRDGGVVEAQVIRRLEAAGERVVGIIRDGRLIPADRRNRREYLVAPGDRAGAAEGELVVGETLPARRFGPLRARVMTRLGPAEEPGAISLIAIAAHDIPTAFPPAALAEARAAGPVDAAGRADLRHLPLVTIDGPDARDFDDAVWAEPDPDPGNPGGWHLVVAIADVASYVRPGSALDREAERRGNSVYFPDRVVPMLPEALSNELCSLQPGADRACFAAELWIDAAGRKRRHRFQRAVMRSAARLTYEQAQQAHDRGAQPAPGVSVAALYGAFAALARARAQRGALELDLPEDRVVLDMAGRPIAVEPLVRLDSHRLVEEFMILANVAAAEELEAQRRPCMYRVHDSPDPAKLDALRDMLDELGVPGLALARGQAPKPALFNRVLRRAAETDAADLVNQLVLRAQAQAAYSPDNIGHFGLALRRYAHFTSPIRRYADLLVHRALLGELPAADLAEIAEHISMTERRAAAAERAAIERYRATLLANSLGAVFSGRVSGVAGFGLFVTLDDSRADGLVPISSLPADFYRHDERRQQLVGRSSGRVFRLGDSLRVRLVEADALGGRLVFRLDAERRGFPGLPRGRRRN